jgi:hypothetical protein
MDVPPVDLFFVQRAKSTTTTAGAKLVVPKPVNLPSIKKASAVERAAQVQMLVACTASLANPHLYVQEHQGNDPSTQLVPSGTAGAGWSKPEEPQPAPQPQPEVRQSALTAGSNWASQGRQEGSSSYVPPVREGPYASGSRGSFPVERHLNPEEYPSLAAGAKEKPPSKRHYEHASVQHQQVRRGDHGSGSHAAAALWLASSTSLCSTTLAGQLACSCRSLISHLKHVQLHYA